MRRPLRLLAVLLLVTLPAALPSAAGASSVRGSTFSYDIPKSSPGTGSSVDWRADPGEANRLVVTHPLPNFVVLRDAAGPIRADGDCKPLADGGALYLTVYGPINVTLDGHDGDDVLGADFVADLIALNGGEGADLLDVHGLSGTGFSGYIGARLDGGPGDDTLVGSAARDVLAGGTGADSIAAGAGNDLIVDDPPGGPFSADRIDGGEDDGDGGSYGEIGDTVAYPRASSVRVDLGAGSGGALGEGDRLVGVESVTGGSADDLLIGDDRRNGINETIYDAVARTEDLGSDRVEGRGGDDWLVGDGGLVLGGDGDDSLHPGPATADGGTGDDLVSAPRGEARCGDGVDNVDGARQRSVVAGDCETVALDDATVSALATNGARSLRLTVALREHSRLPACGALLTLRDAADGRLLLRRLVKQRERVARRRQLTAPEPLPARVRLLVQAAVCERGRAPRVGKPMGLDGFSWEPLRVVAPFG